MRTKKRIIITVTICVCLFLLTYFAAHIPFFEYEESSFETSLQKIFSSEYLNSLKPLFIIAGLSALGIIAVIQVRKRMLKNDSSYSRLAGRQNRTSQFPKQKKIPFMIARWVIMIVSAFMMIWGGLIFGLRMASVSIPFFACPLNDKQMTESSCYMLSHLNVLFTLPLKSIIIFMVSTLGFTLVLGRVICGFLCPMGLIQDIMDKIRKKTGTEGISANEKFYSSLRPVKWFMVLMFIGICFIGGNYCNFCPALAVSPFLAGFSVSLYVSGFIMVFVIMGSFFKRRIFCNICPLGYLVGLFHRISLFRIRKDCQACTECGACYEACPMGIKTIYTERGKADVTEASCIMCGECVKCCPEDNALSLTFAGKKLYTSSRSDIMSGYAPDNRRGE